MKIRTTVAVLLTVFACLAIYSNQRGAALSRSAAPAPAPQLIPTGCNATEQFIEPCGEGGVDDEGKPRCGEGLMRFSMLTAAPGTQGLQTQSIRCEGTTCPSASTSAATFNAACCDQDRDGFQRAACGGSDCNDDPNTGFNIHPGAAEVCNDNIDNDCDAATDCRDTSCQSACADFDGDGVSIAQGDCDDTDRFNFPGNTESCADNRDNNCNDAVNEGCDEPPPCDPLCERPLVCFNGMCGYTPVILDLAGNGVSLTSGAGGVLFDFNGDGRREKFAWTAAGSDDAWLVLDRNGNGAIDDGSELFGTSTVQPDPPPGVYRNGFLALSVFDGPGQGGNGDGVITAGDAVWPSLKLWRDVNHDGVSEPDELHALPAFGIESFSLGYRESRQRDRHGNEFRYRAKVYGSNLRDLGRWAYDVFLVPAREGSKFPVYDLRFTIYDSRSWSNS